MRSSTLGSPHPLVAAVLGSVLAGCGARSAAELREEPRDTGELDGRVRADADLPDAATRDARPETADAEPSDASGEIVSDIGDPCASSAGCSAPGRGPSLPACIGPGSWPNGNAWIDGYCTDYCEPAPPLGAGGTLEPGTCPALSLCVPLSDETGICLRACDVDADCRTDEGYFCRKDFGTTISSEGVCMAMHCGSRGCPGTAECSC